MTPTIQLTTYLSLTFSFLFLLTGPLVANSNCNRLESTSIYAERMAKRMLNSSHWQTAQAFLFAASSAAEKTCLRIEQASVRGWISEMKNHEKKNTILMELMGTPASRIHPLPLALHKRPGAKTSSLPCLTATASNVQRWSLDHDLEVSKLDR